MSACRSCGAKCVDATRYCPDCGAALSAGDLTTPLSATSLSATPVHPLANDGTRNRTIASMILQQALGLGVIDFVVGKISATVWAPYFPKYVLLEPGDALRGFIAVMLICIVASALAIQAALKVDPAEAIGG